MNRGFAQIFKSTVDETSRCPFLKRSHARYTRAPINVHLGKYYEDIIVNFHLWFFSCKETFESFFSRNIENKYFNSILLIRK